METVLLDASELNTSYAGTTHHRIIPKIDDFVRDSEYFKLFKSNIKYAIIMFQPLYW